MLILSSATLVGVSASVYFRQQRYHSSTYLIFSAHKELSLWIIVSKPIRKRDRVKFAELRTLGQGLPRGLSASANGSYWRNYDASTRALSTFLHAYFCEFLYSDFCRAYRPILLFDKANSLTFSITKPCSFVNKKFTFFYIWLSRRLTIDMLHK